MTKGVKGFQKGHSDYLTDKTRKELGIKMKEIHKTKEFGFKKGMIPYNKGKKTGKLPHNWKGGIATVKERARIRDNYTCQICGLREPEIMEVDHILPKSRFKNKEFELENLITLCPNCHRRKTNRDKKQYHLYKNYSKQ